MNLTQLLADYDNKSGEQANNENLFVAAAFVHIIQKYVADITSSYVLTLSCRTSSTCNFFHDILEKIFHSWTLMSLQFVMIAKNYKLHVRGRRYFNILFVDSYQAFSEINIVSYSKLYNYNEFYYIFLRTRDDLLTGEMQQIFDYCWAHQLINCNVQVQLSSGSVLIYTYFPYTPKHCGKVVPVLINQFDGSSLVVDELFPRKLRNLYGCPLRAALFDAPPHVYLKTDEHGVGYVEGGVEGNLLLELASRLNFSIEVKIPPNDEQRGYLIGREWNGAIAMLHKGVADLTLGCYRQTAERDANATATRNFLQLPEVAAVAKSAFRFTSFQILFYPFETSIWMLILVAGALALCLIFAASRYQRRYPQLFTESETSSPFMNVLLVLTGMPVTASPTHHHTRIFGTSLMLFSLVLRAVYQALLFHFIRTGVTNRIPQSFNELVGKNYTIAMTYNTRAAINHIATQYKINDITLNVTDERAVFAYMEDSGDQNMVAVSASTFLLHYVRSNKKAGVFEALPPDIVNLQITMYLGKHSFLVTHLDEEIIWMRSSGLTVAWLRWETEDNYFNTDGQTTDRFLDMGELHATFTIFMVGLSIASVAFCLELISERVHFLRAILMKI